MKILRESAEGWLFLAKGIRDWYGEHSAGSFTFCLILGIVLAMIVGIAFAEIVDAVTR